MTAPHFSIQLFAERYAEQRRGVGLVVLYRHWELVVGLTDEERAELVDLVRKEESRTDIEVQLEQARQMMILTARGKEQRNEERQRAEALSREFKPEAEAEGVGREDCEGKGGRR